MSEDNARLKRLWEATGKARLCEQIAKTFGPSDQATRLETTVLAIFDAFMLEPIKFYKNDKDIEASYTTIDRVYIDLIVGPRSGDTTVAAFRRHWGEAREFTGEGEALIAWLREMM